MESRITPTGRLQTISPAWEYTESALNLFMLQKYIRMGNTKALLGLMNKPNPLVHLESMHPI